jgi:ribonuclease P protein component
MLAKQYKFTKKDFNIFKSSVKSVENTNLGVFYVLKDFKKSAVVVPKKVYKKAVERNRVKRMFYNTLKSKQHSEDLLHNGVLLFVKRRLDYLQFITELDRILDNHK